MTDARLRGIFPIVYTPFDAEGAIVEDDVRRVVRYLIDAGAHGLSACGGASESAKMTLDERRWLAALVIEAAAGDVPVIVGVTAPGTAEAVELAVHAAGIGARAVFGLPPLAVGRGAGTTGGEPSPLTWECLADHYGALAQAAGIPIMVQEVSLPMAPEHVVALRQHWSPVRYVKEEAPDTGHRITAILQRAATASVEIEIFSGGANLLDDLARGAVGAIPGSIGVADLSRAYDCWLRGDRTGARAAFYHFLPLAHWRRPFSLLGAKEVLRRQGVIRGAYLRQPADQTMDDQDHAELTTIMAEMGPPY